MAMGVSLIQRTMNLRVLGLMAFRFVHGALQLSDGAPSLKQPCDHVKFIEDARSRLKRSLKSALNWLACTVRSIIEVSMVQVGTPKNTDRCWVSVAGSAVNFS